MAYTTQICGISIREWKPDLSNSLNEQARVPGICHRPRCRKVAAVDDLKVVAEVLLDIQPVTCHIERPPTRRKFKKLVDQLSRILGVFAVSPKARKRRDQNTMTKPA